MKKLSLLFICAAMLLALVACGGGNGTGGESQKPEADGKPGDTMSLEDIFADILDGVEDLPAVDNVSITDENFKSFLFVDPIEGAEALASEGMINAIAHSAVLLRVPEGTDAEAVAKEIETNADPRKWICAEAEKTVVTVHGQTILLVMSFEDVTDALVANYNELWA